MISFHTPNQFIPSNNFQELYELKSNSIIHITETHRVTLLHSLILHFTPSWSHAPATLSFLQDLAFTTTVW